MAEMIWSKFYRSIRLVAIGSVIAVGLMSFCEHIDIHDTSGDSIDQVIEDAYNSGAAEIIAEDGSKTYIH